MDTLSKIMFLTRFRGYTDGEFSARAGLYKTVLSEWRAGKTKSYIKHIPEIAKALDVSEEFLLDDSASFVTSDMALELDASLLDILGQVSGLTPESREFLLQTISLLHAKQSQGK